jgi:hypothetical protein
MIHSEFINFIGKNSYLNTIHTIIMLAQSIVTHGNVACLFNQEVHRYATVDMKCQMPGNNVR